MRVAALRQQFAQRQVARTAKDEEVKFRVWNRGHEVVQAVGQENVNREAASDQKTTSPS